MSDIIKNIRRLRVEKGLSQEQLAAMLGVTRQTVSNWERGASLPDIDSIVRIAAALDTGIEDVLYLNPGRRGGLRPISAWFILGTLIAFPIFFILGYQIICLIFKPDVQQSYIYAVLWAIHLLAVFIALCFCMLTDKISDWSRRR